jgi:hypothetical protein
MQSRVGCSSAALEQLLKDPMQLEETGCQVSYTGWAITDRRECVVGQLCRLDAQYDEGQDIGATAYGLHGGGVSTVLRFRGKTKGRFKVTEE